MKFVCERCHTKYSIADEKVRGKVLKVRCKTCTNVITVRETGATIDDVASAAPREAPVARSGSFDAGEELTIAAPRTGARSGKVGGLPAAALFAPGTPAAAPPPRRTAPPPAPAPPEIDWYLAVDGAQTGPFSRARLIDKVLAAARDADVHVWNADFDGWKPPVEVGELREELTRRRRSTTPIPPPPVPRPGAGARSVNRHSPSGGHATVAASAAPSGLQDGGVSSLEAKSHHSGRTTTAAPAKKKNGVAGAAGANASAGALAPVVSDGAAFGDLLGVETGATASSAAGLAAARAIAALDPLILPTPGPATAAAAGAAAATTPPAAAGAKAGATAAKRGQVKLLMGALAVVVVLCVIVSVWMFRRPPVQVAVGEPTPAKSQPADFAGLAEKLAQDEANAAKNDGKNAAAPGAGAPAPTAVPDEAKPVVAKIDAPQKGAKPKPRRGRNPINTTPPPLSMTPPPGGLTAEQREAANRFGESTGRDVRIPTSSAGSARTTPAQADISRVINNNRQGIQTCYQRALLRDNTLTHGKVTVRVSIGLSGKVKSVNLDAPAQFRALEPCIRDVMSRWAFPPSSEEYGTEFPVVLQGNQ